MSSVRTRARLGLTKIPRICFLGNAGDPHLVKWANHFNRAGYSVHVVSFEDSRGISAGVELHRLESRLSSSARYFMAMNQAKRIIRSIQPDLVHAHYAAGYGTIGRLVGFHPYVLSVWGSEVFEVADRSALHWNLIRSNLNSADYLCSTSKFMAQRMKEFCSKEVTVTPFGVDCEKFTPKVKMNDNDEFVIGTVKRLDEKYGIEFLIKAFDVLTRKYRSTRKMRLVIAGEGPLRGKLQNIARECGVLDETEFLGFVEHAGVPEVLNRLTVFSALSVSDSETFGVAVVEASACGLPVVVSNAGGLPEVVNDGHTGLVVPRRDALAAAEAISRLIENAELRQSLGTAGRKFVLDNYDWTNNSGLMEQLYDRALQ